VTSDSDAMPESTSPAQGDLREGAVGAVAAGASITARIAADVLRDGGNAADAAVAGALASWISEAIFTNAGSGALILVREPKGPVRALDAFATMPGLQPPPGDQPLDFRLKQLRYGETDLEFRIGRGSVAVPGFPAGLATLHRRYGSRPLPELVAPAVRLAREGVVWSERHRELAGVLSPIMTDTPENAALVGLDHADGRPSPPRLTTMPELGDMIEQLGKHGLDSFYQGPIADAIVADQAAHGGLVTHRDLSAYRVLETSTLRLRLAGWDLWLPGTPSLGGTMVAAMLALWATLAQREPPPTPGTTATDAALAHRWAVVIDAVNANRAAIESAATDGAALTQIIRPLVPLVSQAMHTLAPPNSGEDPRLPGGTTHLSIVDDAGMAVSMSSSAGESAGYLVPGLGTMLNNMLGEGDLHHGGFHRAPPGTRLPTMMAPMLLTQGNPRHPRSILAMGSGGSMRIRTALSQVSWWVTSEGADLAEAIERPRRHFEELKLHLEAARDDRGELAAAERLRAWGYDVVCWPERSGFFGGVHAARIDRTRGHGRPSGHGDSRRDGDAALVGAANDTGVEQR